MPLSYSLKQLFFSGGNMKIVTEDNTVANAAVSGVANGYMRLYNKVDGSIVDVHNVDGVEYLQKLPHLWSKQPIVKEPVVSKEQTAAVDAVIVPEPAKEEFAPLLENADDKPVSARARKLAKFED